jgi:peroxiredoxin
VIDEKRGVVREWRGVKVSGHVQEVLNFVKAL